jgi:hypothetical protein
VAVYVNPTDIPEHDGEGFDYFRVSRLEKDLRMYLNSLQGLNDRLRGEILDKVDDLVMAHLDEADLEGD